MQIREIKIIPHPKNLTAGTRAEVTYKFFGFTINRTYECVRPAIGGKPALWRNVKNGKLSLHLNALNLAAQNFYLSRS